MDVFGKPWQLKQNSRFSCWRTCVYEFQKTATFSHMNIRQATSLRATIRSKIGGGGRLEKWQKSEGMLSREILKTGTFGMRFSAIWSSNSSCSSGNLAGFGNPLMVIGP